MSAPKGWPKPLGDAALIGIAGDVVRLTEPESESDEAALLLTVLIAFGNAVGYGPGFRVGHRHHGVNEYLLIVGETSASRKGGSLDSMRVIELAAPEWAPGHPQSRVKPGLTSGEGLIHHVRDAKTGLKDGEEVQLEEGVDDKRLLALESEFAQPLTVMERTHNTLSSTLRSAWDSGNLGNLSKGGSQTATGAHVSIVGHITAVELKQKLTRLDMASGFANRFLFVCARRTKLLPKGGDLTDADLVALVKKTQAALDFGEKMGDLTRSAKAERLWERVYPKLTAARPGLFGVATARAEAHVMRVAVIYALLDRKRRVETTHLRAALAVWKYAEESAAYIFGRAVGDPMADALLAHLERAGDDGLLRTELRDLVGRHKSKEMKVGLELLHEHGLARFDVNKNTGGAPATRWWRV